jgi:hypothetical protein
VVLVVDRRAGTGEVVDLLHLEQEGLADVVAHQLEPPRVGQVADVLPPSREEVVETDDMVALPDRTLAQL